MTLLSDRDYDNFLIEAADKWNNPFGEIYFKNSKSGNTVNFKDPATYLTGLSQTISSAAQFIAEGYGLGKLASMGGKSLAKLLI